MALLASNAVALETSRRALAIDATTQEVLYVRRVNVARTEAAEVIEEVKDFIKYTAFWVGQLPDMRAKPDPMDPVIEEEVMFRL